MINLNDLKQEIEAYNNTIVHEVNGQLFIDSLKYPHVFTKLGLELGFKVVVLDAPTDREILCGNASSGFEFAGLKFICHAMAVIVNK